MNAWGGGNGTISFKIVKGNSWSGQVAFQDAVLTADFVESGDDGNATAAGLVDGTTYVITLKEADDKISAKIAAK